MKISRDDFVIFQVIIELREALEEEIANLTNTEDALAGMFFFSCEEQLKK